MNLEYYKPIECGDTIPLNNPHAFSVSLPTYQDVIDYEEGNERSRELIKSAYPRIVFHPYIKLILEYASKEFGLKEYNLFLLPNRDAAIRVTTLSETQPEYYDFKNYTITAFPKVNEDDAIAYYSFMKHCGYMIYSREAEDILRDLGFPLDKHDEDLDVYFSEKKIKNVLNDGYGEGSVILSSSGMNAIYTGFKELQRVTHSRKRPVMILFGWAYADTLEIFKKCSDDFIIIPNVEDMERLESFLNDRGEEVGLLYFETVSNPLIAVPDIPKLHELSLKYDFLLVSDNTFATPWCVNITKYCDIIFESLTKFASGAGDVMAGAIVIPEESRLSSSSVDFMKKDVLPLYSRDLYRLTFLITGYKERVLKISRNALSLYKSLLECSDIDELFSVYSKSSKSNWDKIKRDSDSFCGVLSFVPNGDFAAFYDNINLPKGPSLGSEFPLLMPYTLLAHYNETKSEKGKTYLKQIGLSTYLLRLSVSIDDPGVTLKAIKESYSHV